MLAPLFALVAGLSSSRPPCRVPTHEAAIMEEFAHDNSNESDLAIFDLANGNQVCELPLPGGPSPDIAIAADGTIYAAIEPHKETEYTTDMGHLAVFSPTGTLIHRVYEGMQGISRVEVDRRGHLFVQDSDSPIVGGIEVSVPLSYTMYDAKTLRKIRTFALGDGWIDASASDDGRYVAIAHEFTRDRGRVDLIDASNGHVVRQIDVPAERVQFDGSKLYVQSQVGERVISLPNGMPHVAPKRSDRAPTIIDGVAYTEHSGPFLMPGQGIETDDYTRRRVADGAALPTIHAHGIAMFPIVRTPSASAAAATPGPEVALPIFPSIAKLESVYASAHGVTFDDTVRGRHYLYLGDLARIDIPDKQLFVLVDCAANVAVVGSTQEHAYTTFSIDPAPTVTPTPLPPQLMAAAGKLAWRIEPVAANQFHSSDAKLGYRIVDASSTPNSLLPSELNEREYAMTDLGYPSCALRTYGGEPLPVEPQRLFELTDTSSMMLRVYGSALHLEGSPPTLPPGAILVHAEGVQPDGTIKVAVDVKNLHAISGAEALEQFSLPAGYTQEIGAQF